MKLQGRTVLVTGAGGFVGPHLARALRGVGAQVAGLGIESPPDASPLDAWFAADLREAPALRQAVRDASPAAIVHLAGQSSPARSFKHPIETFEINVRGTMHLLDAVRDEAHDARVLIIASGEIYGSRPEGSRATEDMPFRPVNPYGFSKATADAVAEAYAQAHELDIVRVRAFNHTGPGQDTRFVLPSFSQQLVAIERGQAEPVLKVGNLDVVRDFSDVRDIARGYVALLERAERGGAYNLCSGRGEKLSEMVQRLIGFVSSDVRVEPDPERMRPSDIPWLVGDPTKTAQTTDWKTEIPFDRTLEAVLEGARASAR